MCGTLTALRSSTSYFHLKGMLDGRMSNDSVGTILGPRKRLTVLFSSDLLGVIATYLLRIIRPVLCGGYRALQVTRLSPPGRPPFSRRETLAVYSRSGCPDPTSLEPVIMSPCLIPNLKEQMCECSWIPAWTNPKTTEHMTAWVSNTDMFRDAQSRSPLSGIDLWPTAGPGTTSNHFLALVAFFVDAASGQETF